MIIGTNTRGNDRLIVRDGDGTTGLRGGNGDDYLYGAIKSSGQIHMFGMDGEDTLVMDLTKDADRFSNGDQIGYMGQHAYGGHGADTFQFVNAQEADGVIIGRIDDFNASEDKLMLDDNVLDLSNLPRDVRLFEFKDQQWIKFGENAYFAMEGAPNGGAERHFLDADNLKAMMLASRDPDARAEFVDQMNEVPAYLSNSNTGGDKESEFNNPSGNRNFSGSAGDDVVHDTRVRNEATSEQATNNKFDGRAGNDLINAGKGDDTVLGGSGDDSLAGGLDNDLLDGGSGQDFLFGGSEQDTLHGGGDDDVLEGGSGADALQGEQGDDVMCGQQGRDMLFGGVGNDRMSGGENGDYLSGGAGNDRLYGEQGNDMLYGEQGNDMLRGNAGRNTLWAGDGDDKLIGGGWNDRMHGQRGEDTLIGGHGRDTLWGDAGDDWLQGGIGRDFAWGGKGDDIFCAQQG